MRERGMPHVMKKSRKSDQLAIPVKTGVIVRKVCLQDVYRVTLNGVIQTSRSVHDTE